MWEINNNQQLFSFLISLVFGVGYCLFYDIFRSCRRVFKSSTAAVFLGDIVFFIIIAFVTYLLLLALCSGELRGYMFFGIFIGAVVCNFTLSRVFIVALSFVIGKTVWLIGVIKSALIKILQKIYRYFAKVAHIFAKNFKKSLKYLKNLLKRKV